MNKYVWATLRNIEIIRYFATLFILYLHLHINLYIFNINVGTYIYFFSITDCSSSDYSVKKKSFLTLKLFFRTFFSMLLYILKYFWQIYFFDGLLLFSLIYKVHTRTLCQSRYRAKVHVYIYTRTQQQLNMIESCLFCRLYCGCTLDN